MKLIFLGTAQDAGVPQTGCKCFNCRNYRRCASSIALLDGNEAVVVDVTPDFRNQHRRLTDRYDTTLSAVFLTHAHWGHYGGLMQFGKEGWDVRGLPVYLSRKFHDYLMANNPFRGLIERGNTELRILEPSIEASFGMTPIPVPHRDEYSDTFAYSLVLNGRSLLYMPDVDDITNEVRKLIRSFDLVILDGTFYSDREIGHRDFSEIPHPRVERILKEFEDLVDKIIFTHLNHTNPLLNPHSPEAEKVKRLGFRVAEDMNELE